MTSDRDNAIRTGAIVVPRPAPAVEGQGAPKQNGPTEGQAGGIGSPSMVAPTLGSDQKQGSGQGKGTQQKGSKKNAKGDKK